LCAEKRRDFHATPPWSTQKTSLYPFYSNPQTLSDCAVTEHCAEEARLRAQGEGKSVGETIKTSEALVLWKEPETSSFLKTFGLVSAESFGYFLSTRFSSAQHATQKQTGVWLGCCLTLNTGRRLPRVTGEFARRSKCLGGSTLGGVLAALWKLALEGSNWRAKDATFALKRSHRIVSLLFAIKIRRHRVQFLCFCRT
jgi:hypothetical protein